MATLPLTGTFNLNDWARMIAGQTSQPVAPLPTQPPAQINPYGGDVRTYGQRGAHQWFTGAGGGSGMDAFIQALGPPANPPSPSGSPPPSAQGPGPGGDSGETDFGFSAPARGNTIEDIMNSYVNNMAVQNGVTPAFNPSGIFTGRDVFNPHLANLPATAVSMLPFGAVGLGIVGAGSGYAAKNDMATLAIRDPAAARALETAVKANAPQEVIDELIAEANQRAAEAAAAAGTTGNYAGLTPGEFSAFNDPHGGYAPGETPVDWSALDGNIDANPASNVSYSGEVTPGYEPGETPMGGDPNPGPGGEGPGGGGSNEESGCVIATELLRQEIWTSADRRALVRWCVRTLHGHAAGETVRLGYRTWGRVAVRLMGASPAATRIFKWLFGRFAEQVTGINPTLAGRVIYVVGRRFCWLVGLARGWTVGGDTVQMRDR